MSLLVAGCGLLPGPGAGIVDRIRAANSPIVQDVILTPPTLFVNAGEEIRVEVEPAATDAEVVELWCHVIVPAGATQLPKGDFAMSWGDPTPTGRHMPIPICPDDGSPARAALDVSWFYVGQSAEPPSSTGALGSVVFRAARIENSNRVRIARVRLHVTGTGTDASVVLTRPVQWLRPAEVANVEATWAAPAGVPYPDVRVEVTGFDWYAVDDPAWYSGGIEPRDVTCTSGSVDVPPQCSATNWFAVPLSFVQYVYLKPSPGTPGGYAAFVWQASHPTIVKPGETRPLDVTGLATWWEAAIPKMPKVFYWYAGGSLAADQPGFGEATPFAVDQAIP